MLHDSEKRAKWHGMISTHLEPVEYTAGEAADITGLTAVQQRNYRRHGLLPKFGRGWARYTAPDLADLLIMNQLSRRGVTPSSAKLAMKPTESGSAAALLTAWALRLPGSVMSDPDLPRRRQKTFQVPKALPRYAVFSGTEPRFVSNLHAALGKDGNAVAIVLDLKAHARRLLDLAGPLWLELEGRA